MPFHFSSRLSHRTQRWCPVGRAGVSRYSENCGPHDDYTLVYTHEVIPKRQKHSPRIFGVVAQCAIHTIQVAHCVAASPHLQDHVSLLILLLLANGGHTSIFMPFVGLRLRPHNVGAVRMTLWSSESLDFVRLALTTQQPPLCAQL